MECTQCLVKPAANQGWTTKIDNTEYGPYLTRDMALSRAIGEALQCRRNGVPARVSVMDARGVVLAKRCLCRSFGR